MSSDESFTLSTMALSEDYDEDSEIEQERQIQLIAQREKQIREAKKKKQTLRRKWFRMILLFNRKRVIKEYLRFGKHRQNLVNQCIELTSKTFLSKAIFNGTDISIAHLGIPSIVPIRILANRPKYQVNPAKKADRIANNYLFSIDYESPLASLMPQSLDTISSVVNLGISIPPHPNKIEDADNAAPGAALNALPTVPPYTPEQAAAPLLAFIPVDYSLRRENRPYTAAAKAAEALINGKSFTKGFNCLTKCVKEEFKEIENLEFAIHEENDYSYDETQLTIFNDSDIADNGKEQNNIENEKVEETKKNKEIKGKRTPRGKVKKESGFVFNNRHLIHTLEMRTQALVDSLTDKIVVKKVVSASKASFETNVIEKPIQKFAKRVVHQSGFKPKLRCEFDFLDKRLDKNMEDFLDNLIPHKKDETQQENAQQQNTKHDHLTTENQNKETQEINETEQKKEVNHHRGHGKKKSKKSPTERKHVKAA
ncbi:hypothetical protein TRFO_17143 [Tritrichomonas foetus]|uniref:Uncharacterized protein n=1 Tax=Tritrichomonas foetus TaxID=1144522 RepID=A0A1J4KNN1_9EUKA|nr:hypothetical protein TRFO_17143 [Tritrichomonas foetus]|eukprot:OHT12879.1 hypothetical protein TRFO_17143 [Tritrichomonas foetus]